MFRWRKRRGHARRVRNRSACNDPGRCVDSSAPSPGSRSSLTRHRQSDAAPRRTTRSRAGGVPTSDLLRLERPRDPWSDRFRRLLREPAEARASCGTDAIVCFDVMASMVRAECPCLATRHVDWDEVVKRERAELSADSTPPAVTIRPSRTEGSRTSSAMSASTRSSSRLQVPGMTTRGCSRPTSTG